MGELAIRKNRGFSAPRYSAAEKTEKPSGSGRSQALGKTAAFPIPEPLRQLMARVSQAEFHAREGRGTLQAGEGVLTEVQDALSRMAELALESAGGGEPGRDALQAELEQLRDGIDRMAGSAVSGGVQLFSDGGGMDLADGAKALLRALMDESPARPEAVQALPEWLMKGISQNTLSVRQLLSALGLDQAASGAELLAAVTGRPLDSDSAAGRLAALYLGAAISGGISSGLSSPDAALEGLRKLLEKISEGLSPDQAAEQLTNGAFTSLADFQAQFTGGTAPGLQAFLVDLLLSGGSPLFPSAPPLLALLAELDGLDTQLMMQLLATLQTPQAASEAGATAHTEAAGAPAEMSPAEMAPAEMAAEEMAAEGAGGGAGRAPTLQFGQFQVTGQDLSGVSFDASSGELSVEGQADVTVRGTGHGGQAVLVAGTGTVTLQNVSASVLTAGGASARISIAGRNAVGTLRLREGVSLTLGGSGVLKAGSFRAAGSNVLRITGGAVEVGGGGGEALGTLGLPVLLDAPASLAARASSVSSPAGTPLEPFDIVWKTLLPGWSGITSITVDGRQAKMALSGGGSPDLVRLWLETGDPSAHGHPAHTLAIRGKDAFGHPKTRYAYLLWNRPSGAFRQVSMYPNPFSVTGGVEDQDWTYEERSHTLHILSNRVTALSGGFGMDASQAPFSGRIVLADSIGAMELALGGVICRVSSGRAFSLGCGNDITLTLHTGTNNLFASGAGCAGISLGDGTSLRIGCAAPRDGGSGPAGTLTAAGGPGGAGIGAALGVPARAVSLCRGTVATAYRAAPGADAGTSLFGGYGAVLISGGPGTGSAEPRTRPGIPLQMGNDTITLPRFSLSSRALRLDRLDVSTQAGAQAAGTVIYAGRLQVAQIQAVYHLLHDRLEQGLSGLHCAHQYIDMAQAMVRDTAAAGSLLEDMRRSILSQSSQAMRTHNRRSPGDVRQLLR